MLIVCRSCRHEHHLGWAFVLFIALLIPLMVMCFAILSWLLIPDLSTGFGYMMLAIALGSFLLAGFACEYLLGILCYHIRCPDCGGRRWLRRTS